MQPDNIIPNNLNTSPDTQPPASPVQQPVTVSQPVQPIIQQPIPQPVQAIVQPPIQQSVPQQNYSQTSYSEASSGYFGTLKALFTNPKAYFDNPPVNFLKSVLFPAINILAMGVILMLTRIIATISAPVSKPASDALSYFSSSADTVALKSGFELLTGDFWGALFKNFGLSSLYAVIFLAAIAGIIMIFALIAKKDVVFKDILSMSSIFSLNFLAVAVVAVLGLLNVWVINADFNGIMNLIMNLVTSLVFVYAAVLMIQGITTVTGFNLFKSTTIFVASAIILIFICGKMISTFAADFSMSFGGYNNSLSSSTSAVTAINQVNSTYKDIMKQYGF